MFRYRYDMIGASFTHKELRHPQIVIMENFPDATGLEPVSIADCWMFDSELDRANIPFIVKVPKIDPGKSRLFYIKKEGGK